VLEPINITKPARPDDGGNSNLVLDTVSLNDPA